MKGFTKKESKKETKPYEILSQDDLIFIRGGDGDPPPVENDPDK